MNLRSTNIRYFIVVNLVSMMGSKYILPWTWCIWWYERDKKVPLVNCTNLMSRCRKRFVWSLTYNKLNTAVYKNTWTMQGFCFDINMSLSTKFPTKTVENVQILWHKQKVFEFTKYLQIRENAVKLTEVLYINQRIISFNGVCFISNTLFFWKTTF